MGCKHSKIESVSTIYIHPAEISEEGVEGSSENEDLFSPILIRETTPRDLRKIREELFAKHSMVAIASSATSETLGSMESVLAEGETNPFCGGRHEIRFLDVATNSRTTLSSHTSDQKHYYPSAPMGKGGKPVVPIYSMASTHHHPTLTDRVPISEDTPSESDESSSVVSGFSHLDLDNVNPAGYQETDFLIDTMAMSLEPLSIDSERSSCMRKKQPRTLGALVDSLTFRDEDDEDNDKGFTSIDGDDHHIALETEQFACSIPDGATVTSFEMGSADKGTAYVSIGNGMSSSCGPSLGLGSTRFTHSIQNSISFPTLETNTSAELLSDVKRGAMMTHTTPHDKALVMLSFSKGSGVSTTCTETKATAVVEPPTLHGLVHSCDGKLLKYHRTNSVALSLETRSVCSDFGRWT